VSPPDRADRKPSLPRPSPTGSPVAKAN
jgi:hypothetical protein